MVQYENRQVPEGINVSQEHPLKEFFVLLFGLTLIIIVAAFVLALMAESLAKRIPFSVENQIAASFSNLLLEESELSEEQQALLEEFRREHEQE